MTGQQKIKEKKKEMLLQFIVISLMYYNISYSENTTHLQFLLIVI